MASIHDVAERAGVSAATVSNYLNATKPVSHALSERIQRAVEELHYTPSAAAKSLRRQKNHEIGVLLPNLDDPYYVQIFQGIEKTFFNSGYFLNAAFSDDIPEAECAALEGFSSKQVCGLILITCRPDSWKYYYDHFTSKGCPIVMIDRRIKSLDASFVTVDTGTSVRQLTSALLARGFQRIYLFSGGLKDNPHLSYGFLTGILRVAKESIFSGLNNLKINSILDERYSEYFGFTSSEVHEMADYYHASDKYQELCEWYDGYLFGNTEIFNPWSVIGYFNNNCRPKAFWQSTGSNDIIREVLASATPDIMERLELLMKGESFVTHIDTGVIYPQIQNDPSSVYSFLLVAGYLKAVSCDQSYGEDYMCEVALPNKEISFVYSKEILSQLENIIPRFVAIAIQEAIYKVDSDSLQKTLEKFLLQTISFHDAADETFYHGLILGMCAVMDNSYRITSNREAGDGRFDIQMLPLNKRLPGILIELKAGKDRSEAQLEDLANVALQQINDRACAGDVHRVSGGER